MQRTGGSTVAPKQNSRTTGRQLSRLGQAVSHGVVLAICCLLSYKIIVYLLAFAQFVPRDDELLGGMWAVVATIFVFRYTYEESVRAALSRISATLFSFGLCLVYLLIFPFRSWGMVLLIGIGAIVLTLIGRSEDIITACITTAVVMVVAGISPQHAWIQPILRLIDTVVGIVVGIVGAWIGLSLTGNPVPGNSNETQRESTAKGGTTISSEDWARKTTEEPGAAYRRFVRAVPHDVGRTIPSRGARQEGQSKERQCGTNDWRKPEAQRPVAVAP